MRYARLGSAVTVAVTAVPTSGMWQDAKVCFCEGFRMPARARRFDGAPGPAFESLQGRKPRGGWRSLRPGAGYGDLARRPDSRGRPETGLDVARLGVMSRRKGLPGLSRGRARSPSPAGGPSRGAGARAGRWRVHGPAKPWPEILRGTGSVVMTCRSGSRSGEPAGSRRGGSAR